MRITYRGGYNKLDPQQNNKFVLPAHAANVKNLLQDNKKIGIVTYAKDDGYYEPKILKHFGSSVDIISYSFEKPHWEEYDVLYLLGGNTLQLRDALKQNMFSLNGLKPDIHLIGDSAGSMVLSTYFYSKDNGNITFYEGLHPNSDLITIVHADNNYYAPDYLFPEVESFAKENNLTVLTLNENEEKDICFDENTLKPLKK